MAYFKLRMEGRAARRDRGEYRGGFSPLTLLELGLGIYFTFVLRYAIVHQIYVSIPFLLLFQIGYLYTAILSLGQGLQARRGGI